MAAEAYKSAISSLYLAIFHSARAVLFRDGVREKSHYCVGVYLEKYVEQGVLEEDEMKIKIIGTEDKTKGRLYKIEVAAKEVKLLLTWHSLDRIDVWSLKPEQVLETLLFPEEVVTGHNNRFIAHKRYNGHIIRAVYEYDINLPVLVTVYYPTAKRYFNGGRNFADKILP